MGDSTQTFKEFVELNAAKVLPADDDSFMTNDYAGGNIDDAYHLGWEAGYAAFARVILSVYPDVLKHSS